MLYVFLSGSLATPALSLRCQRAASAANPVVAENSCPGTTTWRMDKPAGPSDAIEGFTAPASVDQGGTVKLYVSTTASSYTFQVYRIGWYQGLGARLMYTSASLHGIQQPAPVLDPATRMVSCSNWQRPALLTVPATWVSGVYIVKLLSSSGYERYMLFVVRSDASTSPILFSISILTYQAYNQWGGYSLYRGLDAQGNSIPEKRAYVVAFDRPYDRSAGLGDFPLYSEYALLRWMEYSGYNVSYATDIDIDLSGSFLLHHRLFIAAGHDEYWSTAMRVSVTEALNAGVSLAFFGGNDLYWHVRLQSSVLGLDRELVCYKPGYYIDNPVDPLASLHPNEDTVLWSDKPVSQPESLLLGESYGGVVIGNVPLVLASGAAPLLAHTGLHPGSAIPGLVGGEYDRVISPYPIPAGVSVLASSPLRCVATKLCPSSGTDNADATLHTGSSGASVFDAGTFYWAWGLDNDSSLPGDPHHNFSNAGFQRFTANLLAYLVTRPKRANTTMSPALRAFAKEIDP